MVMESLENVSLLGFDDQDKLWPAWKQLMAMRPYLTERDIAALTANVDPTNIDWLERFGDVNEYIASRNAGLGLLKAVWDSNIRDGVIPAIPKPTNGGTRWAIRHEDFAKYCAKQGKEYPLPSIPKPFASPYATETESRKALEQCHDEIAHLRAKVSKLEREKQSLKAQIDQANAENSETEVKRLKRALGALALGLASDAPKWRNQDNPNVSALTGVAIKGVSDERGEQPHGYGKTTIYDAIKASIDYCRKELDS